MRVLVVWCLAGCSPLLLPPPSPPPRSLPDIALTTAPPSSHGRVVVDVTNGPARVEEVIGEAVVKAGRYRLPATVVHGLGTTPCVVDLPHGVHELELTALHDDRRHDRVSLDVQGGETSAYVRTLGLHDVHDGRAGAGAVLLILGTALTVGGIVAGVERGVGWGLGLGLPGAFLMITAIPLAATARSVEQPGSATTWRLPD